MTGGGVSIRRDGTFPLRLGQGDNEVKIERIPIGYTVKSVTYGSLDLLKNTLRLQQATPADTIVLTLAPPPDGSVAGVKVSGKITNLPPSEFFPPPRVGTRVRLLLGQQQFETPMSLDGTFEFPAVPRGVYRIGVCCFPFSTALSQPTVEVADRDLTSVVVALPIVTVVGHVTVVGPGGQAVSNRPASFGIRYSSPRGAGGGGVKTRDDTIFAMVPPIGPVSLVFDLPPNYSVKSETYGAIDLLKTSLNVDGSVNPMDINITLEYKP